VGWVGGTAKEFLPPGSAVAVGVVGVRRGNGGADAERLEEGVEPAFVQVHLLVAETEEDKEDVGEEGDGPDEDAKLEAEDRVLFEGYGRELVVAVEFVVSVFPRDPGGNVFVEGIGQELV